ncbi:MAG: ParB/RepB/Spo0J family partition protein [Bdellovibrionales bacterium]
MSELINENQNKRKGLGRGLGSLLSGDAQSDVNPSAAPKTVAPLAAPIQTVPSQAGSDVGSPQDKVWTLSIEKLKGGVYQPRKSFEKESLQELANSIKEHGILQPLIVRPTGSGSFEIVAGERRWRAAQQAGLHEVPVLIRQYTNQKTLELSLIENLQREDLNAIEEAEGYQRLQQEFSLTQEQIADRVGKERATVANSLRLLKLPLEVRKFLQEGKISQGHAKVLLSVSDPIKQKKFADLIVADQTSVRKLETMIATDLADLNGGHDQTKAESTVTDRLILGLSDELQKILGTKVSIDYKLGKGKVNIHFYSDEELSGLVDKIREA